MDYFLIRQSGTVSIPKAPKTEDPSSMEPSVRIMENLSALDKFDYIDRCTIRNTVPFGLRIRSMAGAFWAKSVSSM